MSRKHKGSTNSKTSSANKSDNVVPPHLKGVYINYVFMTSVTSLVGNVIKVYTSTGDVFEGIFRCFSSDFDLLVELCHKVEPSGQFIAVESVVNRFVIKAEDISHVEITDVDFYYATKSLCENGSVQASDCVVSEKQLQPWTSTDEDMQDATFDIELDTATGWNVSEMFQQNQQIYGCSSSFDVKFSEYTVPLHKDTKMLKEATKIASEIKGTSHTDKLRAPKNYKGDMQSPVVYYKGFSKCSRNMKPRNPKSVKENTKDLYAPCASPIDHSTKSTAYTPAKDDTDNKMLHEKTECSDNKHKRTVASGLVVTSRFAGHEKKTLATCALQKTVTSHTLNYNLASPLNISQHLKENPKKFQKRIDQESLVKNTMTFTPDNLTQGSGSDQCTRYYSSFNSKIGNTVNIATSKLNPNAKEFIYDPSRLYKTYNRST